MTPPKGVRIATPLTGRTVALVESSGEEASREILRRLDGGPKRKAGR